LHWLQAIFVIWLLVLGLSMVDLPKGAERSAAYTLHKSLGLLVLLLSVLRLAWRLGHRPPPDLSPGWEARLARLTHLGLYAFLLLAPLSGYLTTVFTPYPLKFFGLELPRLFAPDEGLNALAKQAHYLLSRSGLALLALHLLGVAKHLAHRQPILQRMLPGRLLQN
jgi:cytochrome b561